MEPDHRARDVWANRVNEIYAAAEANGFFVARGEPRKARLVDDNVLEVYLELAFGRDDQGRPLIPIRRGEREPWLVIEEWIEVEPNPTLQGYNYDLIDGSGSQHFGIHFHGHGGPATAHRQGIGVPGGHEMYRVTDVASALWEILDVAFAHRLGRG